MRGIEVVDLSHWKNEALNYGDKENTRDMSIEKNPDISFCSGKIGLLLRLLRAFVKRCCEEGSELTQVCSSEEGVGLDIR